MKQHTSSHIMNLRPLLFAVTAILLGAIVAVGASHVEGGILQKAIQSIASVPGMGWVASWIKSTIEPDSQQVGSDAILGNNVNESQPQGSVPRAEGLQGSSVFSALQSSTLFTPTPLPSGSSINPTATAISQDISATTTLLPNESPTITVVEEVTPSPTIQGTVTPTSTELPGTRHLSLSSVDVKPGERFQVYLSCDNTEGVAGCDIRLEFMPDLVDLVTVQKTDLTEPFLLVKRKEAGTFVLSLASFDGLAPGNGVLLSFEGVSANNATQDQVAVVSITKAKLYNTESKAFEVRTSNGMIHIKRESTEVATRESQATPEPEIEVTPFPTTPLETSQDPIPESTSSYTSADPTSPPVFTGGGFVTGPIPTNTSVVLPSPTRTLPPSPSIDSASPTPTRLRADLNKDGEVNALDLMEFMRNWKQVFPTN